MLVTEDTEKLMEAVTNREGKRKSDKIVVDLPCQSNNTAALDSQCNEQTL